MAKRLTYFFYAICGTFILCRKYISGLPIAIICGICTRFDKIRFPIIVHSDFAI